MSPKRSDVVGRLPTSEEIADALEAAGYPLELRVYRQFDDAQMAPVLSFRYRADEADPHTKEIDVLARLNAGGKFVDGEHQAPATISLWIPTEVKRVHNGAFVGIRGKDPSKLQRRHERSVAAGVPSWKVLGSRYDTARDVFIGDGGIAESFDLVNERPYCVQWATVKADKSERRFAGTHDVGCADDLQRLVRSSALLAREITNRFLQFNVEGVATVCPDVTLLWPLLVVDAPLYVYDPAERSLHQTEWFTLRVGADLGGRPYEQPIDIVSAAGVPTIISKYLATGQRLSEWLATKANVLAGAAHGQVIIHRNANPRRPDFISGRSQPE